MLNHALENEGKVSEEIEMMLEVLEEHGKQFGIISEKIEESIKPYLNKKNIEDEIHNFWNRVDAL